MLEETLNEKIMLMIISGPTFHILEIKAVPVSCHL